MCVGGVSGKHYPRGPGITDTVVQDKKYAAYCMRENPAETQVIAFLLRKRDATLSLKVGWNGIDLEHS